MLPVRSAYYIKASLRRRFRAVIALELEKYAANSNNRFVAQTVAYVIHQVSPVYSFIHHFLRALSQSKLTPRYVLSSASPAMHPTLTAYAAVILHLPSDLALPFDVKSFPQKDEPWTLGNLSLGNQSTWTFSPAPYCCSLSLYISYHIATAMSIVFSSFS